MALLVVLPLLMITLPAQAEDKSVTLTILQTSDLHSNLLPYDSYTGNVSDWGLAKVATRIKQECDKDPAEFELEHLGSFEVDVQRRWPDVAKAKELLGWEAQVQVRDGIRRTVEWLRAQT